MREYTHESKTWICIADRSGPRTAECLICETPRQGFQIRGKASPKRCQRAGQSVPQMVEVAGQRREVLGQGRREGTEGILEGSEESREVGLSSLLIEISLGRLLLTVTLLPFPL